MKKFIPLFVIVFLGCRPATTSTQNNTSLPDSTDKGNKDTLVRDISNKQFLDSLRPLMGYRFEIEGDFNGDGKKEKLTEHYYSCYFKRETEKFYENLDYSATVDLTIQKDNWSFLFSSSEALDTLYIAKGGQTFGLAFLRNEGDLDGNGTDEISYVQNYADWSSINTCHLMTYAKNGWTELYHFTIHDWELPDMPEVSTNYGLFGADGINKHQQDDTLNQQLEDQLTSFTFIRKIKKGVIEVAETCMEEDENNDTITLGDQIKKIVHLNQ